MLKKITSYLCSDKMNNFFASLSGWIVPNLLNHRNIIFIKNYSEAVLLRFALNSEQLVQTVKYVLQFLQTLSKKVISNQNGNTSTSTKKKFQQFFLSWVRKSKLSMTEGFLFIQKKDKKDYWKFFHKMPYFLQNGTSTNLLFSR